MNSVANIKTIFNKLKNKQLVFLGKSRSHYKFGFTIGKRRFLFIFNEKDNSIYHISINKFKKVKKGTNLLYYKFSLNKLKEWLKKQAQLHN
jgi:hypothetical protein